MKKEKQTPGILDIRVAINEGKVLSVGEDVMVLAVAGDIRQTVIRVLERTLNAVKTTVTRKTEFFIRMVFMLFGRERPRPWAGIMGVSGLLFLRSCNL
ncbi:MAG: hypothetical protein R2860_15115 [Desulfobacterales bacterium]